MQDTVRKEEGHMIDVVKSKNRLMGGCTDGHGVLSNQETREKALCGVGAAGSRKSNCRGIVTTI